MKRYYRDAYGCTASITKRTSDVLLSVRDGHGRLLIRRTYATEHGARIALGRCSDCWRERARA